MFCKYKNILGQPNKGIHKYRIFNMAVMDILFTIIGAYIISIGFKLIFWRVLLFLFILGIFLHRIFCARTTIDKLLFINSKS